jgi:pSer/pThr/pTyr-binding forkhead associated (FHA) protein
MAAATSDPRDTTLVLTDSESGELIARRWIVEVVAGPDAGKKIERKGGTIVVGSHSEADFTLTDPSVSRYHAELRLMPEGVLALDLGSKNGMKVGNARVERALIPAGGTVKLGRTEIKVTPKDCTGWRPRRASRPHADRHRSVGCGAPPCCGSGAARRIAARPRSRRSARGRSGDR